MNAIPNFINYFKMSSAVIPIQCFYWFIICNINSQWAKFRTDLNPIFIAAVEQATPACLCKTMAEYQLRCFFVP